MTSLAFSKVLGHQLTTPVLKWGMLWQEVSRLGSTMYFGELALLNNEPRKASVKVSSMALLNGVPSFMSYLRSLHRCTHQPALRLVIVISGVRMHAVLAVGTAPPVTCQSLSLEQHHTPAWAAWSPAWLAAECKAGTEGSMQAPRQHSPSAQSAHPLCHVSAAVLLPCCVHLTAS